MIQLTDEQRQALQAEPGKPIDVINPDTHERFVLLGQEQYERVRSFLERPPASADPSPQVTPLMLRSMQAFWRLLPELLKLRSRRRQWVAFNGDKRIGFGSTDAEMYQKCFQHGLQYGEFYVGKLEPDPEGIPPWGTFDGDWSLYESKEVEEDSSE